MNDMTETIAPKSDQMNADDLIAGPRTITIREVKIAPGTEQPVAVFFNGDEGKPYLPCKSMRRVMVALWGPDASVYSGRSMTLYRDPTVTWGGMEVGGIRISHMTHIEKTTMVVLTATKKARKPFKVEPLVMGAPKQEERKESPESTARRMADELLASIRSAGTLDDLHDLRGKKQTQGLMDRLAARFPEMGKEVSAEFAAAYKRFETPPADAIADSEVPF